MVPVLIVLGYLGARNIQVGDATPGSSLFWPWHRYNQDGFRIAFSMPILSPLYILLEGEEKHALISCPGKPKMMCGENFKEMYDFQKYMRETPGRIVMFVDSIITTYESMNQFVHEGDPHWSFLGSADRYCDEAEERAANILIYCRDKTTPTIKAVMGRVTDYVKEYSKRDTSVQYKLAGGAVGVQAAVNEVIEEYHFRTLGWALLSIFVICWIMFRSVVAAFLLTIPLIVSNLIAFSMMATGMFYLLPVPITITQSTLPVSAVGIGLGVDYGIYMLSRILEEYAVRKNMKDTITTTMASVGEPIVFTALAMTGGLIVWAFSPLMFQATMGFFLATILLLNMLGGLLLVPSFVAVIKPKFVVGKNVAHNEG
jgi:predicted RND superfamily exporter protein